MDYKTFVKSIVIVPVGHSIFSELVTTVSIDDEAAGPFVVVEQDVNDDKIVGRISIDQSEWPSICKAIESQLRICTMIEKNSYREASSLQSETDGE